jgi:excisionase family DNA binding protein
VSNPARHPHRSDYLSIAEAAAALGVGPKTINNYFNAGRLHRIRVSRKVVLVARSEVDALLAGRHDPPGDEDQGGSGGNS